MSSDADYASFLDKVNQPTGSATSQSQSQSNARTKGLSTKTVDIENVPSTLKSGVEDVYYVSDADEPFELVGLKWDGPKNGLNESSFQKVIGATGSVSEISAKDFDPRGDYKQILAKVDEVTSGGVKIFRVEGGHTRVEYFVVGISKEGTALVGAKAKAVES